MRRVGCQRTAADVYVNPMSVQISRIPFGRAAVVACALACSILCFGPATLPAQEQAEKAPAATENGQGGCSG